MLITLVVILSILVGSANAEQYFVTIGAEWCPGCVTTERNFKALGIPHTHYDVDIEPKAMKWLKGTSIPQILKVKDGKIVNRVIGAMSQQQIKEFIK